MPPYKKTLLRLDCVHKRFGSTHALRGINLELIEGEILILMGVNGAGKSMLAKLVGGIYELDDGAMYLDGKLYQPSSPHDALRAGVVTVHQHVKDGLIADMTVAENLSFDRWCLGDEGWFFTAGRVCSMAKEVATHLNLQLDWEQQVRELSLADRQLVAIARALSQQPRLLILDEPTASLSQTETERLFGLLNKLRKSGCTILYISHQLSDIEKLADRVAVLKDGCLAKIFEVPVDRTKVVESMLGYTINDSRQAATASNEVVLEVRDLQLRSSSRPMNFAVHRGEVIAATGLLGSGKTEFAECLFGERQPYRGSFLLKGQPYQVRSARQAINRGVFMLPEDREQALVADFCLFENLVLPFTAIFSRWGWLQKVKERALAKQQILYLKIVCASERDPIECLSGGNQQKIVLARWLCQPSQLLVLDEPFSGIDLGSRRDIADRLRSTANERATLVLCSDPDEAVEIADRILVFHEGNLNGEHSIAQLDRQQMLQQMLCA